VQASFPKTLDFWKKVLLLQPGGLIANSTAIFQGAQKVLGQVFVIAGGAFLERKIL
jgi:hypothetical protein